RVCAGQAGGNRDQEDEYDAAAAPRRLCALLREHRRAGGVGTCHEGVSHGAIPSLASAGSTAREPHPDRAPFPAVLRHVKFCKAAVPADGLRPGGEAKPKPSRLYPLVGLLLYKRPPNRPIAGAID